MLILLAGSCESTCLKFGVPILSGGKLGLTSERFCVTTLCRGRLGVFLCLNMSAFYVYAKVFRSLNCRGVNSDKCAKSEFI